MTVKFNMTRDINGYNGFGLPFYSGNSATQGVQRIQGYSTVLATTVEQHFTIPSNAVQYIAIFSIEPGANVWVDNNVTAVLPSGSFAATTSQANPTARVVNAGDVLSFITNAATAEVGVALYAI